MRVSQLIFGPYPRYLVNFRVMGPDLNQLRTIANQVQAVMRANPHTRQVNQDSGERTPTVHFVLDQDRLQLMGLSSSDAAEQLQFLLSGVPVTQVREDIRAVEVVARSAGPERLDPARLGQLTLTSRAGRVVPLSQIGHIEIRAEDPILRRRDRTPTITVQSDFDETLQPPEVSMQIEKALAPIIAHLPEGYSIETGGNIEDSAKANSALLPILPIMVLLTLVGIASASSATKALKQKFSVPGKEGWITNTEIARDFHGTGGNSAPLVPVVTLPAGETVASPGVRPALRGLELRVERVLPGSRVAGYGSDRNVRATRFSCASSSGGLARASFGPC